MNKATGINTRANISFLIDFIEDSMGNSLTNKYYVDVRQPEIDHIRKTGKSPELGMWDKLAQLAKYKGTEWANDIANDHRYDVNQYSDPDKFRDEAFNQAKEQALTDYQSMKQGIPGPYSEPSSWMNLKTGKYRHK